MNDPIKPYDLLVKIAEDCRQNSVPLPSQDAMGGNWRGIGFRLGGRTYVAPILDVNEVLTLPGYTRVPGVKAWFNGIANIRGRLLTVVDLGMLLGMPASAVSATCRVLAIKKNDLYSGVIVEEVLGMQAFSDADRIEPGDVKEGLKPFVTQAFEKDGQRWQVFNLSTLSQSSEFMAVSA